MVEEEIEESNSFVFEHSNNYIIGAYTIRAGQLFLGSGVDAKTYFKYNNSDILHHLICNNIWKVSRRTCCAIRVMRIHKIEPWHMIIDKTIWIRLIQRHWKAEFKKIKERRRPSAKELLYREVKGVFRTTELSLKKNRLKGLLRSYVRELRSPKPPSYDN